MDDRAYFELGDEELTSFQLSFLAALRELLEGRLRPYCAGFGDDTLLLALDVDAPDVALVNVGLELRATNCAGTGSASTIGPSPLHRPGMDSF